MKTRTTLSICATVLMVATGCGGSGGDEPAARTQQQRDSAIAESNLPGAGAVGRAMEVSDSAAARAARMDSIR